MLGSLIIPFLLGAFRAPFVGAFAVCAVQITLSLIIIPGGHVARTQPLLFYPLTIGIAAALFFAAYGLAFGLRVLFDRLTAAGKAPAPAAATPAPAPSGPAHTA